MRSGGGTGPAARRSLCSATPAHRTLLGRLRHQDGDGGCDSPRGRGGRRRTTWTELSPSTSRCAARKLRRFRIPRDRACRGGSTSAASTTPPGLAVRLSLLHPVTDRRQAAPTRPGVRRGNTRTLEGRARCRAARQRADAVTPHRAQPYGHARAARRPARGRQAAVAGLSDWPAAVDGRTDRRRRLGTGDHRTASRGGSSPALAAVATGAASGAVLVAVRAGTPLTRRLVCRGSAARARARQRC